MRSLSYFIDVLAIIAFMYILQAQEQAESTEVIIREKEGQIAGYAKEIDIIRKFDHIVQRVRAVKEVSLTL